MDLGRWIVSARRPRLMSAPAPPIDRLAHPDIASGHSGGRLVCILVLCGRTCARDLIAGWIEREQRAGRVYTCADQNLGGFPVPDRIPLHQGRAPSCRNCSRRCSFRPRKVTAAVQVYQPTLLIAEIDGPVSIADLGQAPKMTANWSLAQMSLRGTPRNPQRVSFAADKMTVDRSGGDKPDRIFSAETCRAARPDRVRHGAGQSGDRCRDLAGRRDRARPGIRSPRSRSISMPTRG